MVKIEVYMAGDLRRLDGLPKPITQEDVLSNSLFSPKIWPVRRGSRERYLAMTKPTFTTHISKPSRSSVKMRLH